MTFEQQPERPAGYPSVFSGAGASGVAPSSFDAPAGKQRGAPTRADKIALGQLKGSSSQGEGGRQLNWSIYTVTELCRFRDEILAELPPTTLSKFNLEEEVMLQFHTLRALQGDVLDDKEVPVNQRAQVANTVASTLKTLGDQQIALYSSERFKDVENALIRQLDKLPEDLAASFIEDYALILKKHSKI